MESSCHYGRFFRAAELTWTLNGVYNCFRRRKKATRKHSETVRHPSVQRSHSHAHVLINATAPVYVCVCFYCVVLSMCAFVPSVCVMPRPSCILCDVCISVRVSIGCALQKLVWLCQTNSDLVLVLNRSDWCLVYHAAFWEPRPFVVYGNSER